MRDVRLSRFNDVLESDIHSTPGFPEYPNAPCIRELGSVMGFFVREDRYIFLTDHGLIHAIPLEGVLEPEGRKFVSLLFLNQTGNDLERSVYPFEHALTDKVTSALEFASGFVDSRYDSIQEQIEIDSLINIRRIKNSDGLQKHYDLRISPLHWNNKGMVIALTERGLEWHSIDAGTYRCGIARVDDEYLFIYSNTDKRYESDFRSMFTMPESEAKGLLDSTDHLPDWNYTKYNIVIENDQYLAEDVATDRWHDPWHDTEDERYSSLDIPTRIREDIRLTITRVKDSIERGREIQQELDQSEREYIAERAKEEGVSYDLMREYMESRIGEAEVDFQHWYERFRERY